MILSLCTTYKLFFEIYVYYRLMHIVLRIITSLPGPSYKCARSLLLRWLNIQRSIPTLYHTNCELTPKRAQFVPNQNLRNSRHLYGRFKYTTKSSVILNTDNIFNDFKIILIFCHHKLRLHVVVYINIYWYM